MLRLFVISLILVSVGFINSAEIDKSNVFSDIYNFVQSLKQADLSIGDNLTDLKQTTWSEILKCLIPDLKGARDGLTKLSRALTTFINTLQKQSGTSNWNTVHIPDRYFKKIIDSAAGIKQSIVNILHSKLIKTIADNSGTLESYRGWVVIPRDLGVKIQQILTYISQQFGSGRQATLDLQKALNDLTSITQADKDGYVPYLFRKAAKLAGENANDLGDIAADFDNVIKGYTQITKTDSNGNLLIPTRDLADTTGEFGNNLANSYYRLADSIQAFIDMIASSSEESS